MNIKSVIKKILLNFGINIENSSNLKDLNIFISRFNEMYKPIELVRVGGDGDGGYLMPNILDTVRYCFSPGVGNIAEFETQLSKNHGIKSFMADASVEKPPLMNENFFFVKKFLGSRTNEKFITLSDWVRESISEDSAVKILQMDIEGGEYDVLTFESAETLAKFSCMIIEFHSMQNMLQRRFLQMISAIFEKIYCNFSIAHAHPNNFSGMVKSNGIEIPACIEVTFIRNDLVNKYSSNNKILLPHTLDKQVSQNISELKMPELWWKK